MSKASDFSLGLKSSWSFLDIPMYIQEDDYSCGYVAALTAAKYIKNVNSKKVRDLINPCKTYGTSTHRLVKSLRHYDLKVTYKKKYNFCDVVKMIDSKKPIITCIKLDDDLYHWVVVYGYKKNPAKVLVNGFDIVPTNGKKGISWSVFKSLIRETKEAIAVSAV